jgi:hypothetical protein
MSLLHRVVHMSLVAVPHGFVQGELQKLKQIMSLLHHFVGDLHELCRRAFGLMALYNGFTINQ